MYIYIYIYKEGRFMALIPRLNMDARFKAGERYMTGP